MILLRVKAKEKKVKKILHTRTADKGQNHKFSLA